jgi:hypothetical protein
MSQSLNEDVLERLPAYVEAGQLAVAIAQVEASLSALAPTYFHALQGVSLVPQREAGLRWLTAFYERISRVHPVNALYLEMNGFDINTDEWYVDGFAFEKAGPLDDLDWLADWEQDMTTTEPLVLRGFEMGQEAFEHYFEHCIEEEEGPTDALERTRDLAATLVVLRLQELVDHIHRAAKAQGLAWGQTPIWVTAHDYDLVYISK